MNLAYQSHIGWMVLDVALAHCMKAKIFLENKIAQNFEHFFETERQPADSAYLQNLLTTAMKSNNGLTNTPMVEPGSNIELECVWGRSQYRLSSHQSWNFCKYYHHQMQWQYQ